MMASSNEFRAREVRPKVAEAGGIVVRLDNATPRFLVSRAKKDMSHWIFPKGHIESGESGANAAIREVREEVGIEGEVLGRIGTLEFPYEEEIIQVEFYLLKYSRQIAGGEQRESHWCTYDEALSLLSFEGAKDLLRASLPLVKKYIDDSKLH